MPSVAKTTERRDAVTERWLAGISEPLEAVAAESGPAPKRLRRWHDLLVASKRSRALDDPELFATYMELTAGARDVVSTDVDTLAAQLARIIADGVEQGEFAVEDPAAASRAVFDATGRFHNPSHAAEWSEPDIDAAYERVCVLVLAGLGSRLRASCTRNSAARPPRCQAFTRVFLLRSILATPAEGAKMLVRPSSQRTRKRGGSSARTSSITPDRPDCAACSDSTTILSPAPASIVQPSCDSISSTQTSAGRTALITKIRVGRTSDGRRPSHAGQGSAGLGSRTSPTVPRPRSESSQTASAVTP